MRVRVLLLTVAVLAGACSGDDTGDAAPTTTTSTSAPPTTADAAETTTSTSTTTTSTTTTTTLPPDAPVAIADDAGATYANVAFTITDGRWTNDDPGTALEEDPGVGEQRHLFIGFDATFEDGYPGRISEFDVEDFALVLADGHTIGAVTVDFRGTHLVREDHYTHGWMFPLDDTDLSGASIVFDNGDNVPMTMLLDGPTDDPFPVVGSLIDPAAATSDQVGYEAGCFDTFGGVAIDALEWDLDAGVDEEGRTMHDPGTARAPVGERWLRVDVTATSAGGGCGGAVITHEAFVLDVDGENVLPDNTWAINPDDGESVQRRFGYRVPWPATEITLTVGAEGEALVGFPIEVPSLP